MDDASLKLTVAWIAALASLLVGLLNHYSRKQTERDLAQLKDRLDLAGKERDARRDYEYEARKRLYEACEPLVFQGVELAAKALERIQGLARTASQGNLEPGAKSWMEIDEYYLNSTIYYLLAPLAIQRLLRERLTLLDQNLDPRIRSSYQLLREAFAAFAQDFRIAGEAPALPYDPHGKHDQQQEVSDPARYSWQGFAQGELEIMVDQLIPRKLGGHYLSFGEFQRLISEQNPRAAFQPMFNQFSRFHPRLKPVFWRILVVQAHCYSRLVALHEGVGTGRLPEGSLNWHNPLEPAVTADRGATTAAEAYLNARAPRLFQG